MSFLLIIIDGRINLLIIDTTYIGICTKISYKILICMYVVVRVEYFHIRDSILYENGNFVVKRTIKCV